MRRLLRTALVALPLLGACVSNDKITAPRVNPDEAGLRPAHDALGGEVVQLVARDGLRLAARAILPRTENRHG